MLGSTPPDSPAPTQVEAPQPPPRMPKYMVIRVPRWRTMAAALFAACALVATALWWYEPQAAEAEDFEFGFLGGSIYMEPSTASVERAGAEGDLPAWLVTFTPGAELKLGFDLTMRGPRPVEIVLVAITDPYFAGVDVLVQDEHPWNAAAQLRPPPARRPLGSPVQIAPKDPSDMDIESIPVIFSVRLPDCAPGRMHFGANDLRMHYTVNDRMYEATVRLPFAWGITDPEGKHACPDPA